MCTDERMWGKALNLCEAESLRIAQSPFPAWINVLVTAVRLQWLNEFLYESNECVHFLFESKHT